MLIETNKSLKAFNTFGIDCKARYFVSVSSVEELKGILSNTDYEGHFVIGGGSNMLLTKDINGLVIHINLKGIDVVFENKSAVHLKCMAGENWHELVMYCIDKDYGGIENMSLIPGNVGTAPIQNIGAYGVELKDSFISCEALEIENLSSKTFTKEDCEFGYRSSIFKNDAKGKYIITSVTFELTKENHNKNTSYGAIDQFLANQNITNPTISDISKAVIAIRQSKLPDPALLGNSGSFFKNPVVNLEKFKTFRSKFPEAPYYELSSSEYKIPAGWLIEQAGFKGKRFGDAGVHAKQALVLVNHGNATGTEIWELALKIQNKVREDFGIYIEPEVNII